MELIYDTLCSLHNQNLVKKLYEESFPDNERRDFVELLRLIYTTDLFHAKAVFSGEVFIGFITFWTFQEFVYIEHFATNKLHRNKGYGSSIFREIYHRYQGKVILEVEPPDNETAKRRIHFYEQLGMILTDYPYIQPAYSPRQSPVPLRIMVGKSISTDRRNIQSLADRMVSCVYCSRNE
jgi:GNAT superfamily N-acetyltransferase